MVMTTSNAALSDTAAAPRINSFVLELCTLIPIQEVALHPVAAMNSYNTQDINRMPLPRRTLKECAV